ncbi:hypothetical protein DL98DRAFT_617099 [Cadophora sp. DSE1049]|nr:hypothetical protein DL98DRAFT_617099 [Cadophora sp. DSE1049]
MASSSSVMAGLVCLCLEAAPGYISLAVSAHPRPAVTIASPLHALFHTVPSFNFSRTLDESRGLGCDPLLHEDSDSSSLFSPRRPPHLHHHSAIRFLHSFLLRPPTSFTFFLSKASDLEHSRVLVSSPCPRHYLLLCEAASKFILSSPLSISPPPLCNSIACDVPKKGIRALLDGELHEITVGNDARSGSTIIDLGLIPLGSDMIVEIGPNSRLTPTDSKKHLLPVLHGAYIDYELKRDIWKILEAEIQLGIKIGQLSALGMNDAVLSAFLEYLIADCRS